MGRIFLEHLGGLKLFNCAQCHTNLTNRTQLISTRFTGATGKFHCFVADASSYAIPPLCHPPGRAYLFKRVVNLTFSNIQERVMLTGRHMVRDVMCKNCGAKLGWMYEFATEESQKYKEGRVILEYALITEAEGFPSEAPSTSH
ncbi:hypothetical protein KR026_007210 [Drosophila bipectinata]|nr:hypothetical protein KR026_007210 [Drosophila bipectinata]